MTDIESITKSPFACRIHMDVEPQREVLSVLQGMLAWYNGYQFLWNSGGWKSERPIPSEYLEAFHPVRRMERFLELNGGNKEAAEMHANYIQSGCIMQVARWFSGYNTDNPKWDTIVVYQRTGRVLASALGHDVDAFDITHDWEGPVISFNDRIGRSFKGIIDLIETAIYIVKHSSEFNYRADLYTEIPAPALDDDAGEVEYADFEDEEATMA